MFHFVLKSNLENPVSFVNDEGFEVFEDEAFCVLQVVEETAWGCDEEVDTFGEFVFFRATVGAPDDNPEGLALVSHEIPCDAKDLEGEFSGGGDDLLKNG